MARTQEELRSTVTEQPEVDRGRAIRLGVAWAIVFPLGIALEPATNAPQPWWAAILGFGLLAGIVMTIAGLVQRKTWGLAASLGASAILAVASFTCPTTGHHAFGLWWFGQFGATLALVAGSATALVRHLRA